MYICSFNNQHTICLCKMANKLTKIAKRTAKIVKSASFFNG